MVKSLKSQKKGLGWRGVRGCLSDLGDVEDVVMFGRVYGSGPREARAVQIAINVMKMKFPQCLGFLMS